MVSRIIKKTEMAGAGRLSQIVGIIIFLGSFGAFPIGTFIGFVIMTSLFIIGRKMATKYSCSSCGNPVDNKKVRTCPVCKTSLT